MIAILFTLKGPFGRRTDPIWPLEQHDQVKSGALVYVVKLFVAGKQPNNLLGPNKRKRNKFYGAQF
jgi:hypothetical protein